MNEAFETEIDEYSRYRIGIQSDCYHPEREEYDNMLYLVAYDVRNPKRLYRVAKICLDYGIRVEYSVFECDLDEALLKSLLDELGQAMDQDEDCLLVYRICGACVQRIQSLGNVVRPGKILFYMP